MNAVAITHVAILLAAFVLAAAVPTARGQEAATRATPAMRVGVVGLTHGHAHQLFGQYKRHPEIEIVGIAEPDRQLAAKYVAQYHLDPKLVFADAEEMLRVARPTAVVVYTSTFDHRRVVELCARYKVHVMMEKPLSVGIEDARAIADAAKDSGIHVLVNYETTWYGSNLAAYELARSGALGDVRKIVVHDGHQGPKEIGVGDEFLRWLTDPKLNGAGVLFDFGCYGADLATWVMGGQRPLTVTAVTQQIKPDVYPNVDDEATIVLTYPTAQAILQASWNWPYGRKDMEVYGRTGYAITVGSDAIRVMRSGKEEARATVDPLPSPYDHPLAYFKAVVMDGAAQEPLSSLQTNVVVMEILDAARQSAASGKTVRLPVDAR